MERKCTDSWCSLSSRARVCISLYFQPGLGPKTCFDQQNAAKGTLYQSYARPQEALQLLLSPLETQPPQAAGVNLLEKSHGGEHAGEPLGKHRRCLPANQLQPNESAANTTQTREDPMS